MQYSIVQHDNIENVSFRLDSEFYKPLYLETENKLLKNNWDYLINLTDSIKSFGAYSLCNQVEYKDSGIPFLRCKDIKDGLIDLSDVLFISDETNRLLWKSEIKPQTVLFTMSGSIGHIAIAPENMEYPVNSNQDIAKIITNKHLNPFYLTVFLQSRHGMNQINRLPIGSVQQHIFIWQLERLIIPALSVLFQNLIENKFKLALGLAEESSNTFRNAQNILLSELGLFDWKSKHELSFVKNYCDTENVQRIDAEYFQPKYDEIINAIKNYPNGWNTLENLVYMKKCTEVGSEEYIEEGVPFIRVSNISPQEISEEKYISENLYEILTEEKTELTTLGKVERFKKSKSYQPMQGEILLSKDGTPGIAHHLREQPPKMIPSGGILRLLCKDKRINADYLTVVLNSLTTQEQVKRDCGGSIIQHWRPEQIKSTIIPILAIEKQIQIQEKVSESFKFRQKSKHLLECARRAVEIAIEENEEKAIKYLEMKMA